MSRADTWMPLYIGDYLGDTMALEAREHGAYLLLIMHYWRNGPLPDDDRALAGIARVDRAMWLADTGPIVRAFFTARDGKLFHKRIDQEREAAQAVSDTKRAAARARWEKEKKPDVTGGGESGPPVNEEAPAPQPARANGAAYADAHGDASGDAYASNVHPLCISPSPSPSEKEKKERKNTPQTPLVPRGAVCDADGFDVFWQKYPRKDDRGHARPAWAAALRKASAAEIIAGLDGYQFHQNPRFQPLPSTWLRGERWLAASEQDGFDPVLRAVGLTPEDFANGGGRLLQ